MKFEKRVKQIASAERDVDKVLRAARLQRNPRDCWHADMTMEWVFAIIMLIGMFGIFALMIVTSAR